ncbi:16S rRNA (guanine(966)-N(2))-methyltransferase RsmD [Micrococcus sp.]|uniref:16S rRNA (guanine(966)-N(2))-methyltransferase RsmD n=1 Tax=Micrococcus sp. TaxID=1271 RepID=UPI002A91DEB1|nr:16S rRNA (guanine(966)-N(2))-methyltransferase RsmD [Micrococcus sp.]MDY6055663.1 16S rRNA (guanine(966)-N(2))-methyltransferase RsmD [Micrococcus sp.]
MSRVIAGAAAGHRLRSVPGTGTRPTTDRVKEALFSWLEARDWLAGTAVLDLYAGSGALGCEAASRGAASVLLVERSRRAVEACRANAAAVNTALGRTVVRVRAGSVEQALAAPGAPVDLILADPPYPESGPAFHAVLAAAAARLSPGGLMVLERSARDPDPQRPDGLEVVDVRRYGETAVHLWQDER